MISTRRKLRVAATFPTQYMGIQKDWVIKSYIKTYNSKIE